MRVLVLNAGSSSLKASLIELPDVTIARAEERWGSDASPASGRAASVGRLLEIVGATGPAPPDAVGYRVVHGGSRFVTPVLIDETALAGIEAVSELAPLHNRIALDTIASGRRLLPDVRHVACFDTAFHATLPADAYRYPVPDRWYAEWGVRRFGFHGLSVAWSTGRASELLGRDASELGLVVAHLGSGCSVTAVDRGRSAETTMGLTPLEGLMMGTRSGSVDPGALTALLEAGRLSAPAMSEALARASGLAGVSGLGSDVRDILNAAREGNPRAELAIAMFVRRAAAAIGGAATALSSFDGLVMTGGIGERAAEVRRRIVDRLGVLGVRRLPKRRPGAGDRMLSEEGVPVLRIEAREDLMIAADTAALLRT